MDLCEQSQKESWESYEKAFGKIKKENSGHEVTCVKETWEQEEDKQTEEVMIKRDYR